MAEFTKFRTSVGGFNRTDVSEYIETLCAEHKRAMKELEQDRENLSAQLAQLQAALDAKQAEGETLEKKLSETETALAATEAALEEAMTMIEEQDAKLAALPDPEEETEDAAPADYPAMELEAYRRAEATERLAGERARRLRLQLSELLDGVSGRCGETGQEIQALTADIRTNLDRLQEALSDLDIVFDETNQKFDELDMDTE